ncbi:MAG TPA: penicillin-binding transpeptidase domain-containing protein [Methylomirabilota bacterium]|nr:penicillin-binding transpeptidase domain-containing protein [Methylomirabilota bacterium]
MASVAGRLGWLQLFEYGKYLGLAQRQQQRVIEITPRRGSIYDHNLHALAMSTPVDSCFAVPAEVKDIPLAARLLASVLGIPRDVIEAKLDPARSFVWVARKLPPERAQAVAALNLHGIYFQKENQRFYPKRELAAHVLGYVDVDEKGIAGVEYGLDGQIRGRPEKILVMADAKRRWFDASESAREAGADVILTLDERIQYIAERELSAAISRTHAVAGTVIVQNPSNGRLLAAANWPRYNPNAAATTASESRMDRAVAALYEPGSTFKLITLAAAFQERVTTPDEIFDCENGAVYVAGHRIRDHKPYGLLPVSDILAYSSDVGAIKVALRLGAPKFYEYLRAFGFGAPTGVDLPGESKGLLRPLERWTPVSAASIAMGQEIGVTPIQLITAVSAIANGGLLYKPHIVQEIRGGENAAKRGLGADRTPPRRVIGEDTAATLRHLMEGVVLHGTGPLARLDGWTAGGKTGSAQKIDPATGRYSPTQLIASFVGFAPLNSPAVTILVVLDSPVGLHEGGEVAAPVFKRIAEQVLPYLDVPRDVPVSPRVLQAAYRASTERDTGSLEDFSPVDFSTQPEADVSQSNDNAEARRAARVATVAMDQGGDVVVPKLLGLPMRDVTRECLRAGLEPTLVGTGLAVQQSPEAGASLRRGNRIIVRFSTSAPADAAGARKQDGTKTGR